MDLNSKKSYYLIISGTSENQDDYTNQVYTSRLEDALYRKEYKLIRMGNSTSNVSFIAYKENYENNNELRYDAIELIDTFYQNFAIVKYFNDPKFKKIMKDGSERSVRLDSYNGDSENSYFNEGFSFSFIDQEDFYIPKKSDIKEGIIVEIKNNQNQWLPREVVNPELEWNRMYSLLVKYDRIRCIRKNYTES